MTTTYPEITVKCKVIWSNKKFRCVERVLDTEYAAPIYFLERRNIDAMGEPTWQPWHHTMFGAAMMEASEEDRNMSQFIWDLAQEWSPFDGRKLPTQDSES